MYEKNYVVQKMAFNDLEYFLNNYYRKFPNYHLYQIIPEHYYNGTFAVVILELDDCFWEEGDE